MHLINIGHWILCSHSLHLSFVRLNFIQFLFHSIELSRQGIAAMFLFLELFVCSLCIPSRLFEVTVNLCVSFFHAHFLTLMNVSQLDEFFTSIFQLQF